MGFFGKKKKKSATKDYTDVESANDSLPIAVAVPVATAPPASHDTTSTKITVQNTPPMVLPAAGPITKLVVEPHVIHSRNPCPLNPCGYCGQNTRTLVKTGPTFVTWCLVGLLLFVFWPLFFLPLVMNSTRKSVHTCSKCNAEIAVIHPLEDCCVKRR